MNLDEIDILIKEYSTNLGFADYGAAPCRKMESAAARVRQYVEKSFNAGMEYMARNTDKREDPSLLMDGAKSVMCFILSYKPLSTQDSCLPQIASYAYGKDYHKVIKDKLYLIVEKMRFFFPDIRSRVFVDSAPVLEREWAREAGLGFIGKNNFLISKKHGLHTFIGVILVDKELKYSGQIVGSGCGKCNLCIEACPTGALAEPFCLDSRKCISYQTIESKNQKSEEPFRIDRKNRIFGCDICLNACPWSKRGPFTQTDDFLPLFSKKHNRSVLSFSVEDWTSLTEPDFLSIFVNSPVNRAGYKKILDNLDTE